MLLNSYYFVKLDVTIQHEVLKTPLRRDKYVGSGFGRGKRVRRMPGRDSPATLGWMRRFKITKNTVILIPSSPAFAGAGSNLLPVGEGMDRHLSRVSEEAE